MIWYVGISMGWMGWFKVLQMVIQAQMAWMQLKLWWLAILWRWMLVLLWNVWRWHGSCGGMGLGSWNFLYEPINVQYFATVAIWVAVGCTLMKARKYRSTSSIQQLKPINHNPARKNNPHRSIFLEFVAEKGFISQHIPAKIRNLKRNKLHTLDHDPHISIAARLAVDFGIKVILWIGSRRILVS